MPGWRNGDSPSPSLSRQAPGVGGTAFPHGPGYGCWCHGGCKALGGADGIRDPDRRAFRADRDQWAVLAQRARPGLGPSGAAGRAGAQGGFRRQNRPHAGRGPAALPSHRPGRRHLGQRVRRRVRRRPHRRARAELVRSLLAGARRGFNAGAGDRGGGHHVSDAGAGRTGTQAACAAAPGSDGRQGRGADRHDRPDRRTGGLAARAFLFAGAAAVRLLPGDHADGDRGRASGAAGRRRPGRRAGNRGTRHDRARAAAGRQAGAGDHDAAHRAGLDRPHRPARTSPPR